MSGCGDVCVWVGDYDSAEFYKTEYPVAAKDHKCCECRRPILKGETYEVTRALYDGLWGTYKTCVECIEIRTQLFCEGWLFGGMWEGIEDQAFPEWRDTGPMECLAQIKSKTARDKLANAFNEWFEEDQEVNACT